MASQRFLLYELMLAVAFVAVYVAIIVGSRQLPIVPVMCVAGVVLFPCYFLGVVMIRQHRERRGRQRSDDHAAKP